MNAKKFRRVPTIVEAVRVPDPYKDSPAISDLPNIMAHGGIAMWLAMNGANFKIANSKGEIDIVTLEGTMRANNGDWIVKGVAGEFFPVKPHIFDLNYQPI